jgi:hypothetical protein
MAGDTAYSASTSRTSASEIDTGIICFRSPFDWGALGSIDKWKI